MRKKVIFVVVKRILVIDNHDSFVYNAVQLLREAPGVEAVEVCRNDRLDLGALGHYDGIVLSPGPGVPAEAGMLLRAIGVIVRERIPALGICLGHQALAEAFGAALEQLGAPLHGHATALCDVDFSDPLFRGLEPPLVVGRYHSWTVVRRSLPEELIVTSCDERGEVMSLRHRFLPLHGVQFHPESCISSCGEGMLRNWLETLPRRD